MVTSRDLMTELNKMGTYYHQTRRYLVTILRLFDSQEAARFDEADIKRALFGIEEASNSNWNRLFSILVDSIFWFVGELSNSSIEMTSAGETHAL